MTATIVSIINNAFQFNATTPMKTNVSITVPSNNKSTMMSSCTSTFIPLNYTITTLNTNTMMTTALLLLNATTTVTIPNGTTAVPWTSQNNVATIRTNVIMVTTISPRMTQSSSLDVHLDQIITYIALDALCTFD